MSLWRAVGAQAAAFTLLLSDAVRLSPNGYLNPLGVGAFVIPEAKRKNAEDRQFGLYLDARRVDPRFVDEPRWIPLEEFGSIKGQLFSDFPESQAGFYLGNGWAFVGPPPILHAGTGDVVIAGGSIGTLGAHVAWASSWGILTAGHVGGATGSAAYVSGPGGASQHVGNVVFSQNAAGAGPRGGADVALIELTGTIPSGWARRRGGVVQPLATVEVLRNTGPVKSSVKGMFAWLAYPNTNLVFANTYMTDTSITQQGDSGAIAIEVTTGDVAGHVVGGTGQTASYIQEIDYQLRAIAAQSQFANISL